MSKCVCTALKVWSIRFLRSFFKTFKFGQFPDVQPQIWGEVDQKVNKTQSSYTEFQTHFFLKKNLYLKRINFNYKYNILMKLKGKKQRKWVRWNHKVNKRANSWQTILEMLRTGSCGNSNGLLSLFLYFVVKTMFYISPWFPRAPLPLLPSSHGLCSGGLCVFLVVQIYLGSRGYTGRLGGRGRRVCFCVYVQWKDTCSNSRFKERLILNTFSTLIIIYFCYV